MELNSIKGIGTKIEETLNKLGIFNTSDLLSYFPFRYDVIKRSDLSEASQDDKVIIDGIIESDASVFRFGYKKDKMTFRLNTGSNILSIIIFNRGYLKKNLSIGTKVTVFGKYDKLKNTIIASDVRFSLLGNSTVIEPIYHVSSGINSRQLNLLVKRAYPYLDGIESYIPDYLESKYNFAEVSDSIKELHEPTSTTKFTSAVARYKYEELFLFMLKMNYLKNKNKKSYGLERNINEKKLNEFIDKLPFTLTEDQLKVIDEIKENFNSEYRMNRLVQGDVGSGKTIVSFSALYMNYLDGYQGALMAPTEILAVQHYNNLKKLLKDTEITIELLTGKVKSSEKKRVYEALKSGKADIIIGTHAIFVDTIKYKDLGLVITDEQHRFGVNQRGDFKNKGISPDILCMSATPIPRTYALTLYGDMDVSSIKTMPNGRKNIKTCIHKSSEIKDVLEKMHGQLKLGHQIYVVAPIIEESEKIDLENVYELEEKMKKAFGSCYNIGIMHGKMTSKEKNEVMSKYKNNEIQILISTTIIEVGVDVENATMIVIFEATRFGLSTLHQLRGRVGRNNIQSYCILMSDSKKERLEVLTKTNDGFKVSEEDFKLRGSGDMFGTKQSGDMVFKLSNIHKDYNILLKAKEDSEYFINNEIEKCENIKFKNILKKIDNLD